MLRSWNTEQIISSERVNLCGYPDAYTQHRYIQAQKQVDIHTYTLQKLKGGNQLCTIRVKLGCKVCKERCGNSQRDAMVSIVQESVSASTLGK